MRVVEKSNFEWPIKLASLRQVSFQLRHRVTPKPGDTHQALNTVQSHPAAATVAPLVQLLLIDCESARQ